ncbi:MAG: hypothetical protein LRZ85_05695 [Alphaproteobacteria bacterium]|nr:hypothetical protein [Alphaproteobacteria bacterium]
MRDFGLYVINEGMTSILLPSPRVIFTAILAVAAVVAAAIAAAAAAGTPA